MQNKNCFTGRLDVKAFTLIELLVVVLIIGILAAVALPQYQKAVEKSKATQALAMLKSVYQAAKAYSLANGNWPTSFDELAVDIPWTGTEKWLNSGGYSGGKSNEDWSIQIACSTGNGPATDSWGTGVAVGRISGPYQGAAFGIWERPRTSAGSEALPAETVICVEGAAGNNVVKPFSKTKGTYCKKLFGGTEIKVNHSNIYFKLP